MKTLDSIPVRRLFGLQIHAATMEQSLAACQTAIELRQPLMIGMVNAAKIVAMHRNKSLFDALASSDHVLADGMAVVWASRILGQPLPERIAGIDLFENLLQMGHQEEFSAYFLGATQDVLDEVIRKVRAKHPNLRIAGSHHGYFKEDESGAMAKTIRNSHCDMLFVGMSSPRKETFLAEWGSSLGIAVCHGVGGSFDVLAGKVRRAPRLLQGAGLEWAYRVIQEPRRLCRRYLTTNVAFMAIVLRELLRRNLRVRRIDEHCPVNRRDA